MIAFSPSSVVWQGIPTNRFEIGENVKSSWSFKGEGLPFLSYPPGIKKWDLISLRLRKLHEIALSDQTSVIDAAIQVEHIQGPILLISGQRDRLWPAAQMSEQIMNRLNTEAVSYTHLTLPTTPYV